jgi:hypothetical protein
MPTSRLRSSWFAAAVCVGLLCLVAGARPAEAEVTSVAVDYTAPMGTYGDLTYIYVEATMNGTVDRPDPEPDGTYSVGIMLIYPLSGGNGVGLVDWPNSAFFHYYGFQFCPRYMYPLCEGVDGDTRQRLEDTYIRFSRRTIEDYMWNAGFTWMAVSWDKTVTDLFGETIQPGRHNRLIYGRIERGSDGDFILQDAARFLRDTSLFDGSDSLQSVDKVISMGLSQTATRQHTFLQDGFNVEANGSLVYDGFLVQMNGLLCYPLGDEPPLFETVPGGNIICPELPPAGDAKVMRIATQSEMEFPLLAGARSRPVDDPNQIQYELSGVSHLSPHILDTGWLGSTQQNPADARPFMRGALHNLTEWVVNGVEPPPSVPMEGVLDQGVFTVALDADGNALGGIRLPHMSTEIDGQPAGAPTGTYGALDMSGLSPLNVFLLFGGTYTRFSDEVLAERYPSPEVYKELVTRAADKLLADGYILQEDRDAYAAGPVDVPEPPDVEPDDGGDGGDGDDGDASELPEDSGCAASSGQDLGSSAAVLILLAGLGLARRPRRRREHGGKGGEKP